MVITGKTTVLSHIYCYWHYQMEKMGVQFFGPPWIVIGSHG